MRVTVSEARPQLGHLCARAQDPLQIIVLTRHGRDIAAVVSIEEVQRIWQLQNEAWSPKKCSVTGKRKGGALVLPEGMTVGPDGHIVTHRELAGIVRNIQIRRKEERELLAQGGLDPVEGGEIAYPVNELTIAGSLPDMIRTIVAANDADPHRAYRVPSLLVEGLTVGA